MRVNRAFVAALIKRHYTRLDVALQGQKPCIAGAVVVHLPRNIFTALHRHDRISLEQSPWQSTG